MTMQPDMTPEWLAGGTDVLRVADLAGRLDIWVGAEETWWSRRPVGWRWLRVGLRRGVPGCLI